MIVLCNQLSFFIHRICEGFDDSEGIREFLFALPRFSRDENDRVTSSRKSKIGTIEVVQRVSTFLRQEWQSLKDTEFDQANKKDAHSITEGKHTMSTTRKGKITRKRSNKPRLYDIYSVGHELGRLVVHYHMEHTLKVHIAL